jgi:hypothetical protein
MATNTELQDRIETLEAIVTELTKRLDDAPAANISADDITAALNDHPDMVSVRSFMGKWNP